jgi:hypothetical protein
MLLLSYIGDYVGRSPEAKFVVRVAASSLLI